MNAAEIRQEIRSGRWVSPTAKLGIGLIQANMVALPEEKALDFLFFCLRNPLPCPLIDVVEPGNFEPSRVAVGADLRRDIPRYRLFRDGELSGEAVDALQWWRSDLVTFLLGCSFSFDYLLQRAGIPVRHVEQGSNVPMFITNIECVSSGPFEAPLVVTMRPIPSDDVDRASELTASHPDMHGRPVHVGDPSAIGINDLDEPEFGEPVEIRHGDVPVYWACGVTSQLAVQQARIDIAITHSPGHMFLTDLTMPDLTMPEPLSQAGRHFQSRPSPLVSRGSGETRE